MIRTKNKCLFLVYTNRETQSPTVLPLHYCSSTLHLSFSVKPRNERLDLFLCCYWPRRCHLCTSQVPESHLCCVPNHAHDSLGAVCGRLCEEAGSRERAEAAWGKAKKLTTHCTMTVSLPWCPEMKINCNIKGKWLVGTLTSWFGGWSSLRKFLWIFHRQID